MNDKKKTLLILGAAVAFLVVLTVLILLALKFDIFDAQNPQQPEKTGVQQPVGETPDDSQQPSGDEQTPDDSQGQQGTESNDDEEEEGGLKVEVDNEEDAETEEQPQAGNTITMDDLLAAAGKNDEKQ